MSIEKYLHLFTPVSDDLPDESEYYLCVAMEKRTYMPYLNWVKFRDGKFVNNSVKRKNIIAWLDLSKLIKKDVVREAVANYMKTEGCSCCRDYEGHNINTTRLGELLEVPPYADGSGYNFYYLS